MDVVFFPRNDYPNNIEICNHRLGKKMTYCETTSMIPYLVAKVLLPYVVSLNPTAKIRVGAYFDSDGNGTTRPSSSYLGPDVMAQIDANVIWPDLYFYPSPYSDNTEEGALRGASILIPWFIEKFERKPNMFDFSAGVMSYKQYVAHLTLGCDSSSIDRNKTDYGVGVGNPNNVPYTQSRYYPRYLNARVLDSGRLNNEDYATYINDVAELIDTTLALPNGGLIVNFHHWHDLLYLDYERYPDENGNPVPIAGRNDYAIENGFKPYFNMLAQKNSNDEIYFAGFGEAVAYLVYRQCITKAHMYSPNKHANEQLIIRLEVPNSLNIDTDMLSVPISVKFSTVGTPLENQSIKCDACNLVSLGSNQYIVEIPYSEYAGAVIEKLTT